MISVIVPTCNEEKMLPRCLESVMAAGIDLQLIIVDGASKDSTPEIARLYTDEVIFLKKAFLPDQLNTGAARASGDILLFLHADSRLTPGSLKRLEQVPSNVIGGAYTMQLEGRRLFYRFLSLGGNIYCRLTGTYFGDRGIFVRAKAFHQLGGFAPLPIMADVDFSRRLKNYGQCALLKGPIISSSRKFDQEGALQALYLIIYALNAFKNGADPVVIKNKYYRSPA